MPLYEYECLKCGQRFEEIQKFSDAPVTEHPDCGGAVRKLLSAPAIQFKGSGWYVTDYARAGQQGKSETDDKKAAKAEAKAKAKADGKPEGKAEAKAETGKAESKPESKKSAESTKTTSDSSKK